MCICRIERSGSLRHSSNFQILAPRHSPRVMVYFGPLLSERRTGPFAKGLPMYQGIRCDSPFKPFPICLTGRRDSMPFTAVGTLWRPSYNSCTLWRRGTIEHQTPRKPRIPYVEERPPSRYYAYRFLKKRDTKVNSSVYR